MTDECGCPPDRGHSHPRIATTPLGPFTPETTRGFATIERMQSSGIRLMPWQREFLLRAGEINPRTGMLRFRTFLLVVSRQAGKLCSSTELTHTKRGLVPHGDLVPGDYVYNADGRWTEVLVNHGPEHRPMYRVTLTDGTSLVVADTHEWEVADRRHKTAGAPTVKVLETRAMLDTGLRYRGYRYRLPKRPVLEGIPVADLPMDPYLLGLWLGDGTRRSGRISSNYEDAPLKAAAFEAGGYSTTITYEDGCGSASVYVSGLLPALRNAGVYGNKHVPDVYLRTTPDVRLAVLQGLLDSDGYVTIDGVIVSTTKRWQADAVAYLARSLGARVTMTEQRVRPKGGDAPRSYWRVAFSPPEGLVPFRFQRHIARLKPATRDLAALSVASIEPAPDAVSNCITIADPRGVYLAGPELVPTHNSTAAAAQLLQWLMEDIPRESPALILGAAHTLQIAIEIWDSVVGIATADPELTARLARVRRSNGNIAVTTTSSSRYLPIAATADAARGWSATRVFIDELRTHTDWSAYGALDKTRIAKPGSQVLAASNSGSERSVVFAALRVAAIGSLDDPDTTVGIAEWSAGEDRDIADREGWREAIPALGYTLPWDAVENSLRIDDPAVFRAEMLCQSVAIESTALDATGWAACAVPTRPAPQGHVHLAVSGDQGRVVVAAADETDSGNVQVRIVGDWHGASAVREAATELRRLQRRLKARSVTWAPGMDPAIEAALRSVPPNVVQKATTSQLAAGCLILAREVAARSLRHGDQAVLNAEAVNAGRKASGNGWLFDAPEHPAALWAASMAVRAARTTFTTKEEV